MSGRKRPHRVGPMGDLMSNFCAAFALLGAKLLYWNQQPVTFGSVLLTILISASLSHLITGATATQPGEYWKLAVDTVCANQHYFPSFLKPACAVASPGEATPGNPIPETD